MIDKTLMRLSGMKRIMTMLAGFALVQAFVILLQGKFLAEGIVHSWNRQSLAGLWLPLGLFATAFVIRQLIVWVRNRIGARFAMTSSAATSPIAQALVCVGAGCRCQGRNR